MIAQPGTGSSLSPWRNRKWVLRAGRSVKSESDKFGIQNSHLYWTERYGSHLHCVGFSTPCLPVGKARGLALAENGCNKRLDSDFVDLIISNRFIQAVIKTECVPLNKLRQVNLDSRFIYNHRGKIHANIHRIFFAILNLLPNKSYINVHITVQIMWGLYTESRWVHTSHQKKKARPILIGQQLYQYLVWYSQQREHIADRVGEKTPPKFSSILWWTILSKSRTYHPVLSLGIGEKLIQQMSVIKISEWYYLTTICGQFERLKIWEIFEFQQKPSPECSMSSFRLTEDCSFAI